jgi:ClpP class serine protease
VAKVRSDYGKGRVFGADEALKSGMVDRIGTFDQTVERLARTTKTSARLAHDRERALLESDVNPSDRPRSIPRLQERRRLEIE